MRATWRLVVVPMAVLGVLLGGVSAAPRAAAQDPAAPDPTAPTAASGPAADSTPERLDAAVATGELDQATADLYLAQAFGGDSLAREVPSRFAGTEPWDGTLPLLRLRERLAAMPDGPERQAIVAAVSTADCGDSTATSPDSTTTTHFSVDYGTIGAGLTIADYLSALETSWTTQITSYGWAAPPVYTANPLPGGRYHVRVDDLGAGLYGYVTTGGTHAGFVGDNPNTAWNDSDALASCMVLNDDFGPFAGTPTQAMQATVAHEFHHSIQFGMGAATGPNAPDDAFIEGGATWMEDEVFDGANDNYNYLWPNFADSMGDYDGSPYEYWIVLRGLTERFGANLAGAGEDVWQRFWELISQGAANGPLSTLNAAMAPEAVTLADAFHDQAIASAFLRPCGGGYTLPHCYEEAAAYQSLVGLPPVSATIGSVGGSTSSSLEDELAARWFAVPAGGLLLSLSNTSSGGQLRATAVCDTGSALARWPFPAVAGPGTTVVLPWFNGASCVRRLVVVTNQAVSLGNPSSAPTRAFTLGTAPGTAPATGAVPADFNGDGRTDASVFRPSAGRWYADGTPGSVAFGLAGDVPVPGRWDPDPATDRAVFRPSTGRWYREGVGGSVAFGILGDVPVPADYDGNGIDEIAVFRPSTGRWFVEGVPGSVAFGVAGDVPVPGDYDADPAADIAVYRPSTGRWYVQGVGGSVLLGLPGDVPVPGDYDADSTDEIAVFRPSTGRWYVQGVGGSVLLGLPGDVPVPGNYDADPATDVAVFRPSTGRWFVEGTPGSVAFGLPGDIPLPLPHAIAAHVDG